MIMLIWKISNGAVQGYNIKFQFNQRRGWLAVPTPVKQGSHVTVRRAREASLAHRGALLFNVCPAGIRNMATEHFQDWKTNLDTWLAEIPDQPTVPGRQRAATSNSLLHQVELLNRQN